LRAAGRLAIRIEISSLDRFRVSGTLTLVSGLTHGLRSEKRQREPAFAPASVGARPTEP